MTPLNFAAERDESTARWQRADPTSALIEMVSCDAWLMRIPDSENGTTYEVFLHRDHGRHNHRSADHDDVRHTTNAAATGSKLGTANSDTFSGTEDVAEEDDRRCSDNCFNTCDCIGYPTRWGPWRRCSERDNTEIEGFVKWHSLCDIKQR